MREASVWFILPSVALGAVAATLLQPLMPSLKASWVTGICDIDLDPNCQLKRAQQISGIISSIRFIIIFAVSTYLGRLSDRIGRVPMLRISNIGAIIPVLALYFTDGQSAWAYYSTFVLSGFVTGGTFQMVAYVADCSPPELRARNFGFIGAVQGLALIMSPLLTAFTTSMNNSVLFLVSAIILFLNGLWIELVLPESLGVLREYTATEEEQGSYSSFTSALNLLKKNRLVLWLTVYVIFTALPEQGVVEIVLIYMDDVLGLQGEERRRFSAVFLSFTGFGVFISQTLFMWVLMKLMKLGSIGLLIISTIANVAHMLVYASLSLNHSESIAYSNIALTSLMFVGLPASNAMLSKKTEASEQGLAMGTLDSVRSLVGAFGPVFFSSLYSFFGERNGFPEAPFLFGAAFASCAMLIVLGPLRRTEKGDVVVVPAIIQPLLIVEPV